MESKEEVKITEKDVIDMMDLFTKVPALLLKGAVSSNLNVVRSFESKIESYKNKLSDLELLKIEKVMEMPVPELQDILMRAYNETHQKQLKILADPKAEPFIERNLHELEKVISK